MGKIDHINYRLSQLLFRLHLMLQDPRFQKDLSFQGMFQSTLNGNSHIFEDTQ